MKNWGLIRVLAGVSILIFFGGNTGVAESHVTTVYPMYRDNNRNQVNDYMEPFQHDSGRRTVQEQVPSYDTEALAPQGHPFTDYNRDGVCDFAQDGSNTWHGPGFRDDNHNGVSDWWDEMHPIHLRHEGMRYQDQDQNGINDYFEDPWHMAANHDFEDLNGDGVCDLAQNGGPNWHGPGYIDANHNGFHDDWEPGGRGHGGSRHMMDGSRNPNFFE